MDIKEKRKRLAKTRAVLIFWVLFIGFGAVLGGTCMLIKPDGSLLQMQEMLPYFNVLPFSKLLFQNYVFSGLMLILINGIFNFIAFGFLLSRKSLGYILGMSFGITLMAWITIQFIIFPTNPFSICYFIFGILQTITGLCAIIFYKQTKFINENQYESNDLSDTIVLFFSRMGYTKKIAYKYASDRNCAIEEITTNEKTNNTSGFWWCGRYGMHKWSMKPNTIKHNINLYKNVIIVSPIWVFHISSPIRGFIKENNELLSNKNIHVVLNHFNYYLPKCSIKELNNMFENYTLTSITTKYGNIKKVKEIN